MYSKLMNLAMVTAVLATACSASRPRLLRGNADRTNATLLHQLHTRL